MSYLVVKSFAKINLSLKVVGLRKDGFHDLDMIMLPIKAHDTMILTNLQKNADHYVTVDDFSIPNVENNTVTRALNKYCEQVGCDNKFRVDIHKAIPAKAGLGGGSSNAAFALKGLNQFLKKNLSNEQLFEMSKDLGSDVPFFIDCKPSRCQGTGSDITPITLNSKYYLLIVKPDQGCSTKTIFSELKSDYKSTKNIDDVIVALKTDDEEEIGKAIFNDLEEVAVKYVPEIREIEEQMRNSGLKIVAMTGSGSSVFGMSKNKKLIKKAAKPFLNKYKVIITEILQ